MSLFIYQRPQHSGDVGLAMGYQYQTAMSLSGNVPSQALTKGHKKEE